MAGMAHSYTCPPLLKVPYFTINIFFTENHWLLSHLFGKVTPTYNACISLHFNTQETFFIISTLYPIKSGVLCCRVCSNVYWIKCILQDIYLHNPNIKWNDIIGLDAAKQLVKEAVVYPIRVSIGSHVSDCCQLDKLCQEETVWWLFCL